MNTQHLKPHFCFSFKEKQKKKTERTKKTNQPPIKPVITSEPNRKTEKGPWTKKCQVFTSIYQYLLVNTHSQKRPGIYRSLPVFTSIFTCYSQKPSLIFSYLRPIWKLLWIWKNTKQSKTIPKNNRKIPKNTTKSQMLMIYKMVVHNLIVDFNTN